MISFRFVILLICVGSFFCLAQEPSPLPLELPGQVDQHPLTMEDHAKISALTSSAEWLGPLAPIAISPFFGITILAGVSQFGSEYLPLNSFISENPVLGSPAVFWVFLGLTILTSIPRFTKISKPAAQAIDQLEAYAGIITIVVIRILASTAQGDPTVEPSAMVVQMGVLSVSYDVLIILAAIVNIVVINTVKFFFEVMVWLIPVPFIDACLEVGNKTLCAGLMAIYVWSPMVATIFNLVIFLVCLLAFRWVNRRVIYLRRVLVDPLWAMIHPPFGIPTRPELIVFPQQNLGSFPAKVLLLLQPTDDGWQLVQPRWFRPPRIMLIRCDECQLELKTGLLLNSISVSGAQSGKLLFSKRYAKQIDSLCELLNVPQTGAEVDLKPIELAADGAIIRDDS